MAHAPCPEAAKIHGNHGELILTRCFGARPVGSGEALRSFVPEQNHRPHDYEQPCDPRSGAPRRRGASPPDKRTQSFGEVPSPPLRRSMATTAS